MAYNPGTDSYTEDTTPPAPGAGTDVNPDLNTFAGSDYVDPNARPLVLSPMQQDAVAAATQPPAVDPTTGAPLPVAPAPVAPAAPLTTTPAPRPRAPRAAGAPAAPATLGATPQQQLETADEITQRRIKAVEELGATQAAASEAKADKLEEGANEVRQQQDLRDQFEEAQRGARAKAQALADKAEKDVEGFQYHDYWSTHSTGERVRTAIAGFLMGFGGGVQGAQAFMQNLDAKMNRDMEQQKATLQKKITLAEAKRRGVKDFDEYVRDQRAALDYKAGQQRIALADEVDAMAARGGAKVDKAKAQVVSGALRADGEAQKRAVVQAHEESGLNKAKQDLMTAEAAKNRAEAGRARAQAKTLASGAKEEGKDIEAVGKRMAPLERELSGTQGLVTRYSKAESLANELRAARESGDQKRLAAAVALAKEEGGAALSGGKTTAYAGKTLGQMKTLSDEVQQELSRFTGGASVSPGFAEKLQVTMEAAAEAARQEADQKRAAILRGELSPGIGLARTEGGRRAVAGHLARLFPIRNMNGTPRYEEGGATPGGGAPAAAPAIPPGAVMGTLNGKRGYALGGQFYPLGP